PAGPDAVTVTRGNPALRPETGSSFDIGAGVRRPRLGLDVDVTFFSTRIRDRVAAVPLAFQPGQLTNGGDTIKALTSYANADDGQVRGLELTFGYDFGAPRGYP